MDALKPAQITARAGPQVEARTGGAARASALFIISHSSAGGAQEIWVNLAAGFAARGHRVKLVALYPYRENVRATPDFLPWHYVVPTRPTSPRAQLMMFGALMRLLRQEQADVAFTALPAANALVALAAQLSGSRTRVVTSHHAPVEQYSKALNWLDGITGAMPAVRGVVSVSNAVASSLRNKPAAYRAKTHVIHNALPPDIERTIAELLRRPERDGNRARLVVATGRLAAQKNYPVLIRAARHMPDVTVRIVGDGPDAEALKALARDLGVAGRVDFAGFRRREETLRLLAEGAVFVQPSLYEGHSLALVEAAKLGLPMVVSNVPSQVEAIATPEGPAGLVVDPQDDRALARAILGLLDDPATWRAYARRSRGLGAAATFDKMLGAYEALAP